VEDEKKRESELDSFLSKLGRKDKAILRAVLTRAEAIYESRFNSGEPMSILFYRDLARNQMKTWL
jgi:hypothetical protein